MPQKVLVISDTHLTKRFNQRKFDILSRLISDCDQLILNGDFYEEYSMTFEEFLNSGWSKLFPLMKARNAICIVGNHDMALPKEQYQQFCAQVLTKYELQNGGVNFYFTHGHGLDDRPHPSNDTPKFLRRLLSNLAKMGAELLGQGHLVIYKPFNRRIKKWKQVHMYPADWLITGHTHFAEVDNDARYANSGLFLSPRIYSYLVIENGRVFLKYK